MALGAKKSKKRFEHQPPHIQRAGMRMVGVFGVVGWLLLIGYGIYLWDDARFVRESVEAVAVVLDVEVSRSHGSDGDTSTAYSPTFQFEAEDGAVYTVTPWYSTSDWGFSEGEQITIRYRPNKPEGAVPHGYAEQIFGVSVVTVVVVGIAGVFALVGTLGVWDMRRRMRRKRG